MSQPPEAKLTGSINWMQLNDLEKYPPGSSRAVAVLRSIGSRGMPDEYAAVYELKDAQGNRKAVGYTNLSPEQQGRLIPEEQFTELGLPPLDEALIVIAAQHAQRLKAAIDTGIERAALQEFSPPQLD